jgi:hypothetical protein
VEGIVGFLRLPAGVEHCGPPFREQTNNCSSMAVIKGTWRR